MTFHVRYAYANVHVVLAVLRVDSVERRRLGCLKVLGDSESGRSG